MKVCPSGGIFKVSTELTEILKAFSLLSSFLFKHKVCDPEKSHVAGLLKTERKIESLSRLDLTRAHPESLPNCRSFIRRRRIDDERSFDGSNDPRIEPRLFPATKSRDLARSWGEPRGCLRCFFDDGKCTSSIPVMYPAGKVTRGTYRVSW